MNKHIEEVKALYKKWAPFYDKSKKDRVSVLVGEKIFIKTVNPKKTDRILDVGCGTGKNIGNLMRYTKKVEGTDISPEMLAIAKKRFPKVKLFISNLEDSIPVKSNIYDKITCSLTFQFLENIHTPLREFYRILKPSGKVFLMDFVSDGPLDWTEIQYKNKREFKKPGYKTASKFIKLTEYIDTIDKTGFDIVGLIPLRVGIGCKRVLTEKSYQKTRGKWASFIFCLQKQR